MRCYAGARSTAAPTATLPCLSLYAIASRPFYVVEVGVFNTTTTACQVSLRAMSSTGTVGATIEEIAEDTEYTPTTTAFNSHTSTGPTLRAGEYARASLGAAIGAGVIWTFGVKGLRVPAATTNGIGILSPAANGQIVDAYFVWEE